MNTLGKALATDVARSITADHLVAVLERLVAAQGAPGFIRMDNGPELIAWALRDWCRLAGLGIIYIEPGSPSGRTPGSSRSTDGPETNC